MSLMQFTSLVKDRYDEALRLALGSEREFRERTWSQYQKLGLPDRKSESWKYSSLNSLSQTAWSPAKSDIPLPTAIHNLVARWRSEFDIAVLVNGKPRLEANRRDSEMAFELSPRDLSSIPENWEDGFSNLSAALHQGGIQVRVKAGVQAPRPLLIIHATEGEKVWASTVNRITVEEGAHFQLAEIFLGGTSNPDQSYLQTAMVQVSLAPGAQMNWVRAQQEGQQASHFSEVQVQLQRDANLHMTLINTGGQWSRSSVRTELVGEGAQVHVNGLSFGHSHQHIDQRIHVRHMVGNTSSTQLFKGVLKDRARGVLNGKIYIAQDAQKVLSSQYNHNLLLSNQAEADTKPELEIYADDVKANHGASIGRMDEEKLFYLMSRGLTRSHAMHVLAQAFVTDVVMKIPSIPLQHLAERYIEEVLPEFSKGLEGLE